MGLCRQGFENLANGRPNFGRYLVDLRLLEKRCKTSCRSFRAQKIAASPHRARPPRARAPRISRETLNQKIVSFDWPKAWRRENVIEPTLPLGDAERSAHPMIGRLTSAGSAIIPASQRPASRTASWNRRFTLWLPSSEFRKADRQSPASSAILVAMAEKKSSTITEPFRCRHVEDGPQGWLTGPCHPRVGSRTFFRKRGAFRARRYRVPPFPSRENTRFSAPCYHIDEVIFPT